MALLDGLIWVEQMNYPCFDFPIDVSHETWLLSPLPISIPDLLLTALKKHTGPKTKRHEKSSCHKRRHICVLSPVQERSVNTINLFQKRKRIAEKKKKQTKELEVALTVANELLSSQTLE